MKRVLTVVVPVYNEAVGIKKFLDEELLPVLMNIKKYKIEIIIVDDGSEDETLKLIQKSESFKKMPAKVVALTRNFGKEIALSAGIREANGAGVIMIDGDGQHPVEVIPEMVREWEKGFKVVTAVRGGNTTKHKIGSSFYYLLMKMTGYRIKKGAMDFRLIDRIVVDEFNKFTEKNRLSRGLIDWLGFTQTYIKVETKDRDYGKASYSTRKLATLTVDTIVSMSRTPLIFFGYIGGIITIFSLILGLFILIEQYILGDPMGLDWAGAVAVSVFVAFLVGLVLVSQAITALYVSQIHAETKGRPLYVIDKERSFEGEKNKKHGCGKAVEKSRKKQG